MGADLHRMSLRLLQLLLCEIDVLFSRCKASDVYIYVRLLANGLNAALLFEPVLASVATILVPESLRTSWAVREVASTGSATMLHNCLNLKNGKIRVLKVAAR